MSVTNPLIITGLTDDAIDTAELSSRLNREDCGAAVTFEGRVRTPNDNADVIALEYEAYEERATSQLRQLAEDAVARFDLGGVAAIHRTGTVAPAEAAVVVITVAPHRDAAFDATRWLIDSIKAEVAIWKKELSIASSHWVGIPAHETGSPASTGGSATSSS